MIFGAEAVRHEMLGSGPPVAPMFSIKVLSPDHLRTFDRNFKLKHTFCSSMILRSRYRLRDSLADLQWATFRCSHGALGCYSISWKSYSPNLRRYANPTFSPKHLRTLTKIMYPSTNLYFPCEVASLSNRFSHTKKIVWSIFGSS